MGTTTIPCLAEALMALVFGFEGPEAKSGQPSQSTGFLREFLVREFPYQHAQNMWVGFILCRGGLW